MGEAIIIHLSNLPELLQVLVLRTVVVVNLFMTVVMKAKASLSRGIWDVGCPFRFHVFVERDLYK